jgi:hypothetical protein
VRQGTPSRILSQRFFIIAVFVWLLAPGIVINKSVDASGFGVNGRLSGGVSLSGALVVGATLAGYEPSPDNISNLLALARAGVQIAKPLGAGSK